MASVRGLAMVATLNARCAASAMVSAGPAIVVFRFSMPDSAAGLGRMASEGLQGPIRI